MHTIRRALSFEVMVRMLADILILNVSFLFGFIVLSLMTHCSLWRSMNVFSHTNWALTIAGLVIFYAAGFYTKGRAYRSRYKALVIAQATTLLFLIFGFGLYFTHSAALLPRSVLLTAWASAVFLLTLARCAAALWSMVVVRENKLAPVLSIEQAKSILVIGGGGYIGSALLPKLLARGYHVRLLDCFLYGEEPIFAVRNHPRLQIERADFRQIDAVVHTMQGVQAVVHLGGIVGDPACALDENLTIEVNLSATRMITEVARGHGIRRFVFASSCSVYGESDEILDERSLTNPISLYARSKIACERVLLGMRSPSFTPVVLRFATIYGLSGRTRFDLVVNLLAAKAVADGVITVFGPSQWRPFIHVDDAATAVVDVLEADETQLSGIFNVGCEDQNCTLGDLGRLIQSIVPAAELRCTSDNVDARNYRVSCRRIREQLGFQPKWTLSQGIEQVVEALRNGDVVNYRDPQYSNVQYLKRETNKLVIYGGWEKQLLEVPAGRLAA
jgi:nucleoside-diphosphate-sugar epimerase